MLATRTAAAYAVALVWLLSFGYTEMAGSDLWWHLAAGREILQQGSLWLVDTWSFTAAGGEWGNHEWLADLIYHAWVSLFGVHSLVYWKWLLIVATYGLLLRSLQHQCADVSMALVLTLIAAAVAAPFLDLRPHLYTLLGVALLLFLYRAGRPALWRLLVLFAIWVNLHGGFVFGLMLLALYEVPWREMSAAALRRAVARTAACAAVCLLNPDGVAVLLLPLTYAFDSSSPYRQLGEWLNPFRKGGIRSPLFFVLLYSAPLLYLPYVFARVRRQLPVPWEAMALCTLTLAMALTSRRFIPLAAMGYVVLAAPLLVHLWARRQRAWLSLGLLVALAAVGLWRLLPYPWQAPVAFHYLTAEYSYPRDLLDFTARNQLKGKVFAYYNWGGYLHWRSDGDWQVFIDGRANTVFDDDTYRQYIQVLTQQPGWQHIVESSGADYVLWPRAQGRGEDLLQALLRTGRWQLLYRDVTGYLLVRSTVALPSGLQPPQPGAYRYLTIAQEALLNGEAVIALDFARRARREIPWEFNACALEAGALRQVQRAEPAQAVIDDCKRYFPSAYLW